MASTRSQTREETAPTCHTLNYLYDEEQGFAITVLVHTLRFHIMIDPERFESKEVRDDYLQLLKAVEGKEEVPETPSKKRKRGDTDSGYGSSPLAESPSRRSESSGNITLAQDDREESEAVCDLQNWILEPFNGVFAEKAPASEEQKPKTVHEWFHGQVFYYTLTCDSSGTFEPIEEEPTRPLEKRITDLVPGLDLPKYITSKSVPLFSTSDLSIIETSDAPSPLHPAVVKHNPTATTYFLKLVDPTQPGPVKRELKILLDLASKNLDSKFRVPLVEGLVVDSPPSSLAKSSSRDRPTSILGFLLTPIPEATPLTKYLDSDTAESYREKWAREIERTVKVLHDNGIVWGDAKADNFMVDKENKLWIIDFGGSYTEGWVDSDKADTLEGDEQGTEKIVNAVRDPENFTYDPEEEGEGDAAEEQHPAKRRKTEEEVRELQHAEDDDEVDEDEGEADKVSEADIGEGREKEVETFCYCNKPEGGKMIACDGNCDKAWFHLECAGLQDLPEKDEQWFCHDCKA
ncbi:protein kinase domain-containing protein 1 [Elsinoe australis]|uniref:Protein kinase domain-containing protein 1 n=1 Tax=Elsinoe australis TaxID=40998 RepID=A0A4U7BBL2_9PEZI|nr:protein kinase domain-containing protein 1 [Elsinoe australis]